MFQNCLLSIIISSLTITVRIVIRGSTLDHANLSMQGFNIQSDEKIIFTWIWCFIWKYSQMNNLY